MAPKVDPQTELFPSKRLTPLTLFADITLVSTEWMRRLQEQCFAAGYIGIFDPHEAFDDTWVWHSIHHPPSDRVWKKECAAQYEKGSE